LCTYRLFKNNFAFESYLDLDNFNRNQCELGRGPRGQTLPPDNNLVLVSVNDINSFMTILIIIIFSFENNQINTYRYMHNIYYTTILDVIIQCELGREPGGQASLPDNNLVLVSVNDIDHYYFITDGSLCLLYSIHSNATITMLMV
jgi:hypothetical protein